MGDRKCVRKRVAAEMNAVDARIGVCGEGAEVRCVERWRGGVLYRGSYM